MFPRSKNIVISGGTFNSNVVNTHADLTALQRLEQAVASSAFHNSDERFDPPKCHPNTRVAVINKIMAWVRRANESGEDEPPEDLVLWLNGKAGVGKSAIAQTIAEKCEAAGLLMASFFFSRSDPTRNHGRSLIPTIAYQISSAIPEFRPYLEDIITREPLIFKRSIEAQMKALILDPMNELDDIPATSLIIIDGLDECNDAQVQENILDVIGSTLNEYDLPFIFLIASRPEPQIVNAFNSSKFSDIYTGLELNDSLQPDADIHLFLRESFQEIKDTHRLSSMIPRQWPAPGILNNLIRKASGQFIYASVVKKYVRSARHLPTARLDIVLGLRPPDRDKPFAELDALYMNIFEGLEDIEAALALLRFLCTSSALVSDVELVSQFLNLEPSLVEVCLGDLSSLITIKRVSATDSRRKLAISHTSLQDFLFDPSRSGRVGIEKSVAYAMMAQQCLRNLAQTKQYPASKLVDWPYPFDCYTYMTQAFGMYCKEAAITEDLISDICKFSFFHIHRHLLPGLSVLHIPHFLDWMEKQTWHGSKDAYEKFSDEYLEIFGSMAQKYFAHPKTTLLLVTLLEPSILFYMGIALPPQIIKEVFQLDDHLRELDQRNLALNHHFSQMAFNALAYHPRAFNALKYTVNKGIYSLAVLALLEYLCDHRKHNWVTDRHGWFRLEKRRNKPWVWHQMRKEGSVLDIERRHESIHSKRLTRLINDPAIDLIPGAREESWFTRSYDFALRLLTSLLHKTIATPGNYDPQLVPVLRRSTFAILAMKRPLLKKKAEAAIADLLEDIDGGEKGGEKGSKATVTKSQFLDEIKASYAMRLSSMMLEQVLKRSSNGLN